MSYARARAGFIACCRGFTALTLAVAVALPPGVRAQPRPPAAEQLIANVIANQVGRGEVALIRQPDGDWWISAADAGKLRIPIVESASRKFDSEPYFSLRGLGATTLTFEEGALTLNAEFPAALLPESRIDLSRRPTPGPPPKDEPSLLLSYKLSMRPAARNAPAFASLLTDSNLRMGKLLLRQEWRLSHDPAGSTQGGRRGPTQLLYDDLDRGARLALGDVVSSAGAFGSVITGAGVSYSRLFQLTPDLITQPTASFRTTTNLPSDVEVSVDGTTFFRGKAPPGPILLDNLLLYGGTRNVRVTFTDASGHREVFEQPFLFSDVVLAAGLHEYSYFAGRRSDLDPATRIRYIGPAWQAFHRYGASDSVTLSAGGEGGREFTNAGVGAAYRSDVAGLFAGELLASHDKEAGTTVTGWSGRYTYQLLNTSVQLSRRLFAPGYRSFGTTPSTPFLRSESAISASGRMLGGVVALGASRQSDLLGPRSSAFLRYTALLTPRASLVGEVQRSKFPTGAQWLATVFLRYTLDGGEWRSATATGTTGQRTFEVAAGRELPSSEGFGYRLGSAVMSAYGRESVSASGSFSWNSRYATLDVFGRSDSHVAPGFVEGSVSGSLVATRDFLGWARPINDGFAVARLGVAQPGISMFLNNQLQGKTDSNGVLLIPNIGSYARQTLSLEEKELGLRYLVPEKAKTFTVPYRGAASIDFQGRRQAALAGAAWLVIDGQRGRLPATSVRLAGAAGTIELFVSRRGDFYVDNASPGFYEGDLEIDGRRAHCRLVVAFGDEEVSTSAEGIVCE